MPQNGQNVEKTLKKRHFPILFHYCPVNILKSGYFETIDFYRTA